MNWHELSRLLSQEPLSFDINMGDRDPNPAHTLRPCQYCGSALLQFISSTVVSFSFPSYAALIYSSVCSHTIGCILWFSWVLWTLLSLNFDPRRSHFTTGRDDTCWLIYAYAYHGQPRLLSDSLVSDTYFPLLINSFLFYGVLRLRVP